MHIIFNYNSDGWSKISSSSQIYSCYLIIYSWHCCMHVTKVIPSGTFQWSLLLYNVFCIILKKCIIIPIVKLSRPAWHPVRPSSATIGTPCTYNIADTRLLYYCSRTWCSHFSLHNLNHSKVSIRLIEWSSFNMFRVPRIHLTTRPLPPIGLASH